MNGLIKKLTIILAIGLIATTSLGCGDKTTMKKPKKEIYTQHLSTIGAEHAKEIMYEKVPNGKLIEFGYTGKGEIPIYKGKLIKVGKEYNINVDAKTGKILDYNEELVEKDAIVYSGNVISEGEAKEIILNRVGSGEIKDFKYDGFDSIPTYEGKVIDGRDSTEVLLDARDGKIIGIDKECAR